MICIELLLLGLGALTMIHAEVALRKRHKRYRGLDQWRD